MSGCVPSGPRVSRFPVRPLALLLVAILLLPGCDQLFDKGTKKSIEGAEKKYTEGDYKEAVRLYEAALDGSPKSSEVHYKLALLYADKVHSPVDALHHFRRYLALAPTGAHAKEAEQYQQEGSRLLLVELAGGSPLTQAESVRLKNENLLLRTKLTNLQAQKSAPVPTPVPGAKRGEEPQKPIPPGARTHVVKAGETLGSIATKYYKNKGKYRDIQDANFYSSTTTPKIRPGMTLIIP